MILLNADFMRNTEVLYHMLGEKRGYFYSLFFNFVKERSGFFLSNKRSKNVKRIGKLLSQKMLIKRIAKLKGYREKDLEIFFHDLEDVLIECLASGESVRLFKGLFIEAVMYPSYKRYSFKEKKMITSDPYPQLHFRVTPSWKDRIFTTDEEVKKENIKDLC